MSHKRTGHCTSATALCSHELADQLLHKMTDEGTIAHYNPCKMHARSVS